MKTCNIYRTVCIIFPPGNIDCLSIYSSWLILQRGKTFSKKWNHDFHHQYDYAFSPLLTNIAWVFILLVWTYRGGTFSQKIETGLVLWFDCMIFAPFSVDCLSINFILLAWTYRRKLSEKMEISLVLSIWLHDFPPLNIDCLNICSSCLNLQMRKAFRENVNRSYQYDCLIFPPLNMDCLFPWKNGNITDINEIFDLYNFIALNELIECNNDKLNVCN